MTQVALRHDAKILLNLIGGLLLLMFVIASSALLSVLLAPAPVIKDKASYAPVCDIAAEATPTTNLTTFKGRFYIGHSWYGPWKHDPEFFYIEGHDFSVRKTWLKVSCDHVPMGTTNKFYVDYGSTENLHIAKRVDEGWLIVVLQDKGPHGTDEWSYTATRFNTTDMHPGCTSGPGVIIPISRLESSNEIASIGAAMLAPDTYMIHWLGDMATPNFPSSEVSGPADSIFDVLQADALPKNGSDVCYGGSNWTYDLKHTYLGFRLRRTTLQLNPDTGKNFFCIQKVESTCINYNGRRQWVQVNGVMREL